MTQEVLSINIILEPILKIDQIIFYLAATVLAILTYISAKKGLLNTVNTEYQKKVMDKLQNLSDELFSEFDSSSPNYWAGKEYVQDALVEIHKQMEVFKNQSNVKVPIEFAPVTPDVQRIKTILERNKTDPFVPKHIRNMIIRHLENRLKTMEDIYIKEFMRYSKELSTKEDPSMPDNIRNIAAVVHNKINDELNKNGVGIGQIEHQIHFIREEIQKYYESYNPLK
jgi:uncharacterized protein (UPF0147 family)